ncbi:hypothetical protein CPL00188L_CDS0085 [Escherichia phage WaterSpirit]
MLANNVDSTNPKPPFDFHKAMAVILFVLLIFHCLRFGLWLSMH